MLLKEQKLLLRCNKLCFQVLHCSYYAQTFIEMLSIWLENSNYYFLNELRRLSA